MNDFLQSIRSGNFSKENNNGKQRYNQRQRRQYEPNGNYSRNGNGNGNERKFRPRNHGDHVIKEDTMNTIKETLLTIAANQEAELVIAERRAIAEERKADAFEFIAANLGNFSPEKLLEPKDEIAVEVEDKKDSVVPAQNMVPMETAESAEPTADMNKDEILEMIFSMRNNGSTYNEIASHLAGLDLPTFSGRGKWHAQTIHRLCQNI